LGFGKLAFLDETKRAHKRRLKFFYDLDKYFKYGGLNEALERAGKKWNACHQWDSGNPFKVLSGNKLLFK